MSEERNMMISDREPVPIVEAIVSLRKEILAYLHASSAAPPGLYTFQRRIAPLEPSAWLEGQQLFPRVFWMNREKNFTIAGAGAADTIQHDARLPNAESFQLLHEMLVTKNTSAKYIGGFRFNNLEMQDGTWNGFPSFLFVLPLIQLTVEENRYLMSCYLWIEKREESERKTKDLLRALDRLVPAKAERKKRFPAITRISRIPNRNLWKKQCKKALQLFDSGSMGKIMLARQTVLEFSHDFSPIRYLDGYPYPQNMTYRFYFEPVPNLAFISFTPERLYSRKGALMQTEALAGTYVKEVCNASDSVASRQLLGSEKDIREHGYVKEAIYNQLLQVARSVEMEKEPRVLQLHRLAHLYTRCTATLKPECCNDSTLLSLLHPTPAVGGSPKEEAMRHIMDIEPFCRGWYAAPIGWISGERAEFCVGIRSALVCEATTNLYSGAGLVKGSDPDLEWREVEQKIGDIMAMTGEFT